MSIGEWIAEDLSPNKFESADFMLRTGANLFVKGVGGGFMVFPVVGQPQNAVVRLGYSVFILVKAFDFSRSKGYN